MKLLILSFLTCLLLAEASAQYKLKGTVYDSSRAYPIESVSVMSTAGTGTVTSSSGSYEITVSDNDSVWFSYLGKPTSKFHVKKIPDLTRFDIALKVQVQSLKEIVVHLPGYKEDSAQNRKDYVKAFNWKRPNVADMTSISAYGAGIDINELIRVFQFRKNKSMERFRERLIQEEKDKFVDHKFTKTLVKKLTGLSDEDMEKYMAAYRPSYEFTLLASDYDFQFYIKESAREYQQQVKGF